LDYTPCHVQATPANSDNTGSAIYMATKSQF